MHGFICTLLGVLVFALPALGIMLTAIGFKEETTDKMFYAIYCFLGTIGVMMVGVALCAP